VAPDLPSVSVAVQEASEERQQQEPQVWQRQVPQAQLAWQQE